MAIRVALQHRTTYRFDRPVNLSPHEMRLRPAPHCRTPILGYSLNVTPEAHFLNWQQDPYGNWVARLVFTEPRRRARHRRRPHGRHDGDQSVRLLRRAVCRALSVRLRAGAGEGADSRSSRRRRSGRGSPPGSSASGATIGPGEKTVDMLVRLNQQLQHEIKYLVRMEPGVQTPEETLETGVRLVPRHRLAARADPAPAGPRRALRLRLPDPARRRREAARRAGRPGPRFHRPARVGRGLPAGRRLDRPRPDVGPARRRGPPAARVHARIPATPRR